MKSIQDYENTIKMVKNKRKVLKRVRKFFGSSNTLNLYKIWLEYAQNSSECLVIYDEFSADFNNTDFVCQVLKKASELNEAEIKQDKEKLKNWAAISQNQRAILNYELYANRRKICLYMARLVDVSDEILNLYLKYVDQVFTLYPSDEINLAYIDACSDINLAQTLFDVALFDKSLSWCISAIIEFRDRGGKGSRLLYETLFSHALSRATAASDCARILRHLNLVKKIMGYDFSRLYLKAEAHADGLNGETDCDLRQEHYIRFFKSKFGFSQKFKDIV